MTEKPNEEKNTEKRPEDVPDEELEAVAGGWGHERWYHHDRWGHRGYYRNGEFVRIEL